VAADAILSRSLTLHGIAGKCGCNCGCGEPKTLMLRLRSPL